MKNPLPFFARLLSFIIMSLILATAWYNSGKNPKSGEVNNINGALFFSTAFYSIMAICGIPNMIEDRIIMTKEKTNGCYSDLVY